ncbi:hypothetical protein CBI38_34710 (plasmid) [Rhodococcus oxybenzonivorans]|uniref:RDD domain-containing protein n=2 Tax=Rhodococcus oxybenzonivorans TaxID=1990687 RepID=A0A2S2C6N1_9NOCA|nr:hypothetical protein CBI38_34710 [Rhodococcus oxybenzonivorans]
MEAIESRDRSMTTTQMKASGGVNGQAEENSAPEDTVVGAVERTESSDTSTPDTDYAGFARRAGAFGLDWIAPVVVIATVAAINVVLDHPLWCLIVSGLVAAATISFVLWNRVWEQGRTGSTVGKSAARIVTVDVEEETPIGWRRALSRELAHVIDTCVLMTGWFRPLWDGKRQTLADRLVKTVVVVEPSEPARDKGRLRVVAILTVVVIAGGTLVATTYFAQYRHDQQTSEARTTVQQVAAAGSTALLSYTFDTAEAQLESASTFLTGDFLDYYRKFTEQVVVPAAKEKSVTTQANVVGSSIEQVDPTSATVLVMVNQSTTTSDSPAPSASQSAVRVELEKVGGRWLISAFNPVS